MASYDLKSIVAQNCSEYESNTITVTKMSALSESCSYCVNYVRDKCNKNLFDELNEKITRN